MSENKLPLSNCTIQSISPVYHLKSGEVKREITIGYDKQQTYVVDEIRTSVDEFFPIDSFQRYDLVVWLNGRKTKYGVDHKLRLKHIRPSAD